MKRKLFTGLALLAMATLSLGAARQSDEIKRMGIFISNFTEAGFYNFTLLDDDDESFPVNLSDPIYVGDLIQFGIVHNIINNPKTTVKKCTDKRCPYGESIMSGKAVISSVQKYFDMTIRNQSIEDTPVIHYDGKNYHFKASDWKSETIYYAEVQDVSRGRNVITMTGELYNVKNKKERPGTFTAKAKPYKWNNKDTWAILSLSVEWDR